MAPSTDFVRTRVLGESFLGASRAPGRAVGCSSGARNGPCRGGSGQLLNLGWPRASQRVGCVGTLTSTPFGQLE